MEGSKEWFIRMREETYASIPFEMRQRFISEKVVYNDHHKYKDDPVYRELLSRKRKATKDLDDYKFNKRYADQNIKKG